MATIKIHFDHIANSDSCQVRGKDRNQRRNMVFTNAYGESVQKSRALAGKNNGTGLNLTTQQRLDKRKQQQSNARAKLTARKRVVSTILATPIDPIVEYRQQLAQNFANETGRDIEWAKQRLSLHKWDYIGALAGTVSRSAAFLKERKLNGLEPISTKSYEDMGVKDTLINKLVIEATEKTSSSVNSFSAKRLLEASNWKYELALATAIDKRRKTSVDDLIDVSSVDDLIGGLSSRCSLSSTNPDLATAFSKLTLEDGNKIKQRAKSLAQRLSEATEIHIFMAQQIIASISDWGQCLETAFKCIDQERRVAVLVEATGLPAQWASQILTLHGWDTNKAISHVVSSMY